MRVVELNKSLFEVEDNYYVYVDEDKDGMLYFCKNFYWNRSEGECQYEKEYSQQFAQRFESGDPSIEIINSIWPYLTLYKVKASYQYKLEE